jgi:hypothetical protein
MVRARWASRAATLMIWVRMVAARAAGLTRIVKAHHDHDALGLLWVCRSAGYVSLSQAGKKFILVPAPSRRAGGFKPGR